MLRFEEFRTVAGANRDLMRVPTGTSRRPLFMPMNLRKVDDDRYELTAAGSGFTGHRP